MPDEAPDVVQDQPDEANAPSVEDQAQAAEEKPEFFSDNFDPASLPDELRPAYQQLRADYTRKTQEVGKRNRDQILQQALLDQEFQRKAAEAWGLLEDEEDEEYDDGYVDPDDALRREVAELRQWRDEFTRAQTQQQQADAINNHITTQIESLEQQLGRELSERHSNLLGNLALQYEGDDGMPDVRAAYEEFSEIVAEERKQYVKGKRRATKAPSGQSGSKQVNLKDDQERLNALKEALEEGDEAA